MSTGAACAAGAMEPSHVLRAMGLSLERVQGSVRFSLGRANTEAEVDRAADLVAGGGRTPARDLPANGQPELAASSRRAGDLLLRVIRGAHQRPRLDVRVPSDRPYSLSRANSSGV